MSIKASVDGQNFNGIDKISVDGKTVNLTEEYSGTKNITTNGTHDVSGYANASVNVPSDEPVIAPLNVTANGTYAAPSGTDGYSPVVVDVSGSPVLQQKTITENGTYTPDEGYDGFSQVVANVSGGESFPTVTVTQERTHASGMITEFKSLIPEGYISAVFVLKLTDFSLLEELQVLMAYVNKNVSGAAAYACAYTKVKSDDTAAEGTPSYNNATPTQPIVLHAGAEFYVIPIKPEVTE